LFLDGARERHPLGLAVSSALVDFEDNGRGDSHGDVGLSQAHFVGEYHALDRMTPRYDRPGPFRTSRTD
jgi:hypothetical protein